MNVLSKNQDYGSLASAQFAGKEVFFITGNKSKFEEAKLLLEGSGITLTQKNIELKEVKSVNQEEVVIEKANQAFALLKKPVIVDDTGIYFLSYNNFPGTFTKFMFKCLGFSGLNSLLADKDRTAYFQTMVCFKDEKSTELFTGRLDGKIIDNVSEKFNPDWQYDSIFMPAGYSITLSEVPLQVRAGFSHRKKAFDELRRSLTLNSIKKLRIY